MMSDEQVPDDPTECEFCHEELHYGTTGRDSINESGELVVGAAAYCANLDCPGKVSDLAPAADPVTGARVMQAVEGERSGPGSMGGDNGGG